MMRGIKTRDAIIAGVVIAIIVLAVVGYFVFIRDSGGGGGDNDEDPVNRSPTADAGLDQTIYPGEQVTLNGAASFDPDGDDLYYYWDMDASVDSNNDGINDNDRDLVGMNVTYMYPIAFETTEYFVTLTVIDKPAADLEPRSDTDVVKVIIYVAAGGEEAPEITMGCVYQPGVSFPTNIDAHFIVSVDTVSSYEYISNFTYILETASGEVLLNGSIQEIITVAPNATIRFINTPDVTLLNDGEPGDSFSIKESGEIEAGCYFVLLYTNSPAIEPEVVGDVELVK